MVWVRKEKALQEEMVRTVSLQRSIQAEAWNKEWKRTSTDPRFEIPSWPRCGSKMKGTGLSIGSRARDVRLSNICRQSLEHETLCIAQSNVVVFRDLCDFIKIFVKATLAAEPINP